MAFLAFVVFPSPSCLVVVVVVPVKSHPKEGREGQDVLGVGGGRPIKEVPHEAITITVKAG
jgi:hypothetical protein